VVSAELVAGPLVLLEGAGLNLVSGVWSNAAGPGAPAAALVAGSACKNTAGNGVLFTGTTSYGLDLPAAPSSYTVSAWIKRMAGSSNFGAAEVPIVTLGPQGYTARLYAAESTVHCSFRETSTGTIHTASSNVTVPFADSWACISYTVGGGVFCVYSNGVFQGSNATAGVPGAGASGPSHYVIADPLFVGEIGELLFYDRALTVAEQFQNYEASLLRRFNR
jgi:hypothetical protein